MMSPEEQIREHEAARQAGRRLQHALEQIQKRHYWNALSAVNEAERFLQVAFDAILKSTAAGGEG